MVKGKGKAKTTKGVEAQVKVKPWPVVTSDACVKCPVQCPTGIKYMESVQRLGKVGRGVTCKKELYLRRKQAGEPLFHEPVKLWSPPVREEQAVVDSQTP